MQKVIAVCLIAFSLLLLPGCASGSDPVPTNPQKTEQQVATPEELVTPPPCTQTAPPGTGEANAPAGAVATPKDANRTSFGAFTAQDLDGNTVTEEIFSKSTLTMVNIWGTFCPPCLYEMPFLGELSKEYAGRGLAIIGIVTDVLDMQGEVDPSQIELARDIIADTGAGYMHLLPSQSLIDIKLKDVMYIPETVFVDSNGNVVGEPIVSAFGKEDWIEIIDTHLTEV